MSGHSVSSAEDKGRNALVALVVTLAIQVYVALASAAVPVLAPEIGRDLGVPAKLVGVFVGLVYVGSTSASITSGIFINRYGAIRTSQVCTLFCVVGLLLTASTTAPWAPALVLLAFVMGAGYGPITPASSQLLIRTAPPRQLALTFSIKQTGVPGGAALAGALLPAIAITLGWRAAFLLVAAAGIVLVVLSESTRRHLDTGLDPHSRGVSLAAIFAPLKTVLRDPMLRELALTGAAYSATQSCLWSFLVVYLTESLGFSLIAAGLALTVANVGGIVGRIQWGAVADRWIAPRRLMGLLGLAAAACSFIVTRFDQGWALFPLLAVCAVFGNTAVGWNGIQLSQVARHAPQGQAGAITGATSFIVFSGVVVSPPFFALLATLTGSYRTGFAFFGVVSLVFGLRLMLRPPPSPRAVAPAREAD